MTYTVRYRKPGALFFRKLKNVTGDGTLLSKEGQTLPSRFFVFDDQTRVELPVTLEFRFSADRARLIEADIKRAAGTGAAPGPAPAPAPVQPAAADGPTPSIPGRRRK